MWTYALVSISITFRCSYPGWADISYRYYSTTVPATYHQRQVGGLVLTRGRESTVWRGRYVPLTYVRGHYVSNDLSDYEDTNITTLPTTPSWYTYPIILIATIPTNTLDFIRYDLRVGATLLLGNFKLATKNIFKSCSFPLGFNAWCRYKRHRGLRQCCLDLRKYPNLSMLRISFYVVEVDDILRMRFTTYSYNE